MNESSLVMLSERLAQGPLSPQDALHYAAALADSLRRLHDQGSVVGTLEPSKIMLGGAGVKLLLGESAGGITPYSSPEQLQGQAADARSDIFAFGAIVYEMVAGRKAFEGSNADELRAAILEREPAPLQGDLARVTAKCLAKAPIERWQRMQRVQMELKLQTVFARRGEQEPPVKADRVQAMVREEIVKLEVRLAEQDARLQAAAQAEQALRAEIASLESRLGARLDAGDIRATKLQQQVAEHAAVLSSRLDGVDQTLRLHGSSLQSLESAITQTDDLVERVVEAFDSLEKSMGQEEMQTVTNGRN